MGASKDKCPFKMLLRIKQVRTQTLEKHDQGGNQFQ